MERVTEEPRATYWVAELEALEPRALEAPPPPSPLLLSQQLPGWGSAVHPAFCILQAVEACEQQLVPPTSPVLSIHSHEATRASDKLLVKGRQGPSLWEPTGCKKNTLVTICGQCGP